MANENCLSNMCCPNCSSEEPFVIGIHTLMRMFDDGSDVHGNIEWDKESSCSCENCKHSGFVKDFQTTPVEKQ